MYLFLLPLQIDSRLYYIAEPLSKRRKYPPPPLYFSYSETRVSILFNNRKDFYVVRSSPYLRGPDGSWPGAPILKIEKHNLN